MGTTTRRIKFPDESGVVAASRFPRWQSRRIRTRGGSGSPAVRSPALLVLPPCRAQGFLAWVSVAPVSVPRRQGAARAGCRAEPLSKGCAEPCRKPGGGCNPSPRRRAPSSASLEVGPGARAPTWLWALPPWRGVAGRRPGAAQEEPYTWADRCREHVGVAGAAQEVRSHRA